MLAYSDELWSVLRSHQEGITLASAFTLGLLTVPDLRITQNGSVGIRGDAEVQASVTVTAYGREESLVPKGADAPLAPYGQEISLRRRVVKGDRSWDIPLGRFRITEASNSREEYRRTVDPGTEYAPALASIDGEGLLEGLPDDGTGYVDTTGLGYDADGFYLLYAARPYREFEPVVVSWSVQLRLQDRFEALRADDFLAAEGPAVGATVYDELRRLAAPFPVEENPALADRAVPLSTAYDSRISAINQLCDLIGGAPSLTRDGVLRPRKKDRWLTETTPDVEIEGVIDWGDSMSNDFYNAVQVRSTSNNDIVAFKQLSDMSHPLAVGRAGRRTYKHAAPIYETVGQAAEAAETFLARLVNRRSRLVTVECTPEALLLDVGDLPLVTDVRTGRSVLGEVSDITYPLNPTDSVSVTLTVAEER